MKLIPAKCPDCGAGIKINEGSTSLVCEYCGGNIIVTDVLGTSSVIQNCMILAYSAMESGNYSDAYDHFNRAIEIDLKNPNAWFGKAVCMGMTGKISDDVFGKMMNLFENAINYAPEDKQVNLKKNAAAEIVKILRKSSGLIHLAFELSAFDDDEQFSSIIKKDLNDLKEKVLKTVQKAQDYDNTNNDVKVLMEEITSGKFFTPEEKNLNDIMGSSNPDEIKPFTDGNKPLPLINNDLSTDSQGNNGGSIKKSGCSMVLLIMIMVIASMGLMIGYIRI
jgi:tetratricopeptide (TPR) repeat protein